MTTPLGQITGEVRDVREYSGGSGTTISSTQKYTGGYSITFGTGALPATIVIPNQAGGGLRIGAWIRPSPLSTNGGLMLRFSSGLTKLAQLMWYTSGNIEMHVEGTLRGSIAPNLAGFVTGTWAHVAMTYLPALGTVTAYVNGLPILTYTGVLIGNCDSVSFGGTNGATGGWTGCNMDDMYVDGDVTVDEAPPPDRFLFGGAVAAGSSAQWSPIGAVTNVECVDEDVPDNDTTYVAAESADLLDLYNTTDITVLTDYGIVDVIPIALVKKMATGPTVKLVASDGVNANLESPEKTPGTSYAYAWHSMPLAPDGGSWTEAKLNAAQFGIKSAGAYA